MPTVDVYNTSREKVDTIDLPEAVFGAEVKEHLLYLAVRWQRAKARAGTHKVKVRSEIRGGGKKPYRQKGTGRARQGTTRAPQWRGGGAVFGPVVRDHGHKLNKKVRAAALRSALSRRAEEQSVIVLDDMKLPEIKTKHIADFMDRFELGDMLLVLSDTDDTVTRSARNLQSVRVLPAAGLNVYDVLDHSKIVVTRSAVDAISSRLGG